MDIINKCVLRRKDNISAHFVVVGSISTFTIFSDETSDTATEDAMKRKVAAGKLDKPI